MDKSLKHPSLFEVKDVDREYCVSRIRDFLPERIIDVHTHIWNQNVAPNPGTEKKRTVTWPSRVAAVNPIEDLIQTYRLMLPGKKVTPVIFGNTQSPDDDLDVTNAYVALCAQQNGFPAFLYARPEWSEKELEQRLAKDGFAGVKVYLSLAPRHLDANQITIFDFLPHHQLAVLNSRKAIVILHLPRKARLKDPVNLSQLLEIERTYPDTQVIVAHVGRAYCVGDVGDAFEVLAPAKRLLFDISANTNAQVFEQLIRAVGPQRILFGSDMPITRMRMRRIEQDNRYVNLVPKGLYGDVSNDPNLDEVNGAEAERLSFFLYEEISAFRSAAEAAGLSRGDVEDVFYNNARNVLGRAGYMMGGQ